jgi:hypothetical protein
MTAYQPACIARKFALVTAAAGLLVLVGCAGGGSRHQAIKNNMTPELISRHQRPVDLDNRTHFTWNTNMRSAWNDLARGAYTDRPSRLSHLPTPH